MNLQDDPDLSDDWMVDWYLWFFAARRDAYVINASEVVRDELTPAILRAALSHRYPLSGFMADEHGQTHVGAIDFDTDDGLTRAAQVQDIAAGRDIHTLLESSRRGAHLWVCSWGRVKTGQMHAALKALLHMADPELATDDHVEVFPKLGAGNFGSGALRIPGLHHHLTQEQYPVLREGKATDGGIKATLDLFGWTNPVHLVHAAGDRVHRPRTPYPQRITGFYAKTNFRTGDEPKASEVLAGLGIQVRPGATTRCPMHEDRRRSLTVFKDDVRVFCGAPSCPLNGAGHGVGSIDLSKMVASTLASH